MERRIDPDYVPTDYELENATRLLHAAAQVGLPFQYKNANGNGFQKWVLGLMMLLIVLGVGGLASVEYSSAQRLAALEAQRQADAQRLAAIENKLDRLLLRRDR